MRVLFRTDSSLQIGGGHLYRCATLADELRSRGHEVRFLTRAMPGAMIAHLERAQFEIVRLPEAPLDDRLEDVDARVSADAASAWNADWIVVDHYFLGDAWEVAVRQSTKHLMAIDDLARLHSQVDLLLDQNYYRNHGARYAEKVGGRCRTLTGPSYALLREEFRRLRPSTPRFDGHIRRVLLNFGAADPTNESPRMFRALCLAGLAALEDVVTVVGEMCPHLAELKSLAREDSRLRIVRQPPSIAKVMVEADVYIGACGATTWERLCLGIPSLIVTTAVNQEETAADLHEAGAVVLLGKSEDLSEDLLANKMKSIFGGSTDFRVIAERGFQWVDGHGASRVVDTMEDIDKSKSQSSPTSPQTSTLSRPSSRKRSPPAPSTSSSSRSAAMPRS
jgi:UDP-2,4-diacetamido-2,4,6-trideoxy-beta-L-altropyranose hydrolase